MSLINIPTRTSANTNASADVNDLMTNDVYLEDLITSTGEYLEDLITSTGATGGLPVALVTANTSTAYTIDISDNVYFNLTLTGNCTFTFPTGLTSGELAQFWIYLKQDSTGGRSVTWPSSVKWPMNVVPSLDTTLSTMSIVYFSSLGSDSRWYGQVLGMGYTI
jgi:hypothetical protein